MRLITFCLAAVVSIQTGADVRPRARDLGVAPGAMEPGPLNAITDVAGVLVGQVTVTDGENVWTGVTAILPHGGNIFRDKVPGAVFVGNAFGKLAGSTQVEELGTIESPIVLTNTLSVGTAVDAVVRWTIEQPGNENVRSVNALVGETNDGGLNDIRGLHVTRDHIATAITAAKPGRVDEGTVGAGTGTIAFGWKGGIGTSSRRVGAGDATHTVGVLVQSNYGGKLVIDGVPIWRELSPRADAGAAARGSSQATSPEASAGRAVARDTDASADGSCMIIVATDAPLDARELRRLAARAIFAMARTGSTFSHGSGDFAIAFSTHRGPAAPLEVSGLFEGTLDATEEAIYNSMLKAVDVTGNGRAVRALPIDDVQALLKKYGR
ncbi:P1 family peptidase [soil metagenome]|nr:P1 family peptidase [Acidobacteriota bacterium]